MFLICPYVFMNLATLFLQSLFLQKKVYINFGSVVSLSGFCVCNLNTPTFCLKFWFRFSHIWLISPKSQIKYLLNFPKFF